MTTPRAKVSLATQARNLETIRDRVMPSARNIKTTEGELMTEQMNVSIATLYAMAPHEDEIRELIARGRQ